MSDSNSYGKCINCGRFCPEGVMIGQKFCSEECSLQFERCPNCGKYFPIESTDAGGFCSPACRDIYTNTSQEV